MFSTLPRKNFNLPVTFILSSANAFNLDQSKNLSFGKELTLFYTTKMYTCLVRGASICGRELQIWLQNDGIYLRAGRKQTTIVKTMIRSESGTNPVAVTIIKPRKEFKLSEDSNKGPPWYQFLHVIID